ncbi:MAG: tyrosine-type recombinase/integrase [Psychrobacillus sp.]
MKKHLENFLNYLSIERNSSENTITSYKNDIMQYLESSEIEYPEQMDKASIRKFLVEINSLAPTTRRRKLSAIRSFMRFLNNEDIIEKNHALDIDNAKTNKKLPKVMSIAETIDMLNSTTDEQDRAILETLYGVGCRVAELVIIKKSDIDFENQRVILFGKGNKERIVPINKSAIDAINRHLSTRGYESEYIFASRRNPESPMTTRNARRIVYKYSGGEVHPHMFRHAYATHLHSRGVDIRVIQELLGHADISTTTIYTSLANEQMSNAYNLAHPRG